MSHSGKRVLVLPKARADLDECADYIAADSLDAALRFVDSVQAAFHFLAGHPEAGRVLGFSSPALKGTRVWPVGGFENWLVFYQQTPTEIRIVRVLHGARDIDNLF